MTASGLTSQAFENISKQSQVLVFFHQSTLEGFWSVPEGLVKLVLLFPLKVSYSSTVKPWTIKLSVENGRLVVREGVEGTELVVYIP